MILEASKRNQAQLTIITINTLRVNLLTLMFKLGQQRDYENANKVGRKYYNFTSETLSGSKEHYHTC